MQLSQTNDQMTDHLANDPTTSVMHEVQRHRDLYNDYKSDFNRIQVRYMLRDREKAADETCSNPSGNDRRGRTYLALSNDKFTRVRVGLVSVSDKRCT